MIVNKSNQIIEEYAANCLDENKLKTFLKFFDFLNKNKFGKAKTGRKINGSWAYKYKNKMIGRFYLKKNSWGITYFNLFSRNEWFEKCQKYLSVELKDFVLTHVNTTAGCCERKSCHSVENKIILSKMFTSRVCACAPIYVNNPDGKTLEYAKELALIGKNIITSIK